MKYTFLFILCLFSANSFSQTSFSAEVYSAPSTSQWYPDNRGLTSLVVFNYGVNGRLEKKRLVIYLGYSHLTTAYQGFFNFENSNSSEYHKLIIKNYTHAFPLGFQFKICNKKLKIFIGPEIILGMHYKYTLDDVTDKKESFTSDQTALYKELGSTFTFQRQISNKFYFSLSPKIRYNFPIASVFLYDFTYSAELTIGYRFNQSDSKK